MKKDKLRYLFVMSYLLSFVVLVFEYVKHRQSVGDLLADVQNMVGMTSFSLFLLVSVSALIFALLTYFVYHYGILFFWKKKTSEVLNDEYLMVALLASESVVYVTVATVLSFLSDSIIQMTMPLLGLVVFYSLLRKWYPAKLVRPAVAIRSLFYVTNLLAVIAGFIG